MKSELLLLGAAGAVIVLLVVYMTMDDHTPEAPVKRPRESRNQESTEQKVKKVKEAKKDADVALDQLHAAKEHLKELQKAAEFAKKIDSSGAASVVASNTEKVLAKLESADEATQGMDPAVKEMAMTVATTAGTWLADADNRSWLWEQGSAWYNYIDRPNRYPNPLFT